MAGPGPRIAARHDVIVARVRRNATLMLLALRFMIGLRVVVCAACAYSEIAPLKFAALNLVSAFAWAATLLALVSRVGPAAMAWFGFRGWWAVTVPPLLLLAFIWWLGHESSAPTPAGRAARAGPAARRRSTPAAFVKRSGPEPPSSVTAFTPRAGHVLQREAAARPARQDRVDVAALRREERLDRRLARRRPSRQLRDVVGGLELLVVVDLRHLARAPLAWRRRTASCRRSPRRSPSASRRSAASRSSMTTGIVPSAAGPMSSSRLPPRLTMSTSIDHQLAARCGSARAARRGCSRRRSPCRGSPPTDGRMPLMPGVYSVVQ